MTSFFCCSVLHTVLLLSGANEATADSAPQAQATAPTNATGDKTEHPAAVPEVKNANKDQAAASKGEKKENSESYEDACRVTQETGRPIVVMVGTDWCGPCQMMKKVILPKARELGAFKRVAFAIVNADREPELAQKLTGGGPIPQLVMYRKASTGWMRRKLVGGQTVEAVQEFIDEGIALQEAGAKSSENGQNADSPSATLGAEEKNAHKS
jgi:thioredoxin-like negative regulator of GroEL